MPGSNVSISTKRRYLLGQLNLHTDVAGGPCLLGTEKGGRGGLGEGVEGLNRKGKGTHGQRQVW